MTSGHPGAPRRLRMIPDPCGHEPLPEAMPVDLGGGGNLKNFHSVFLQGDNESSFWDAYGSWAASYD